MLKKRFIDFIYKNKLINEGDGIVIALSGGPDSMCLLHLLNSVKDELNIKLVAAHINHMIRGEEADADERFCGEECARLGIEFFSKRIDVNKYCAENGLSSETGGREIRYNFFKEVMNKKQFNKVATAHNANDQAETIVMRIMRGTGLEGLGGIPVKREDIYIRPILFMKREEIEKYCEDNNLKPRIDKTNYERIYNRNKIRLDILPYIKENFNAEIIESINRMSMLLQEDSEYIKEQVDECFDDFCKKENDCYIISKKAFNLNKAIYKRLIRKVIKELTGDKYDIEAIHVDHVIELAKGTTGKKIDLPKDIVVTNVYGDLKINKRVTENNSENSIIEIKKEEIDKKDIYFGEGIISFNVMDNNKEKYNFQNSLIKYVDYDKIINAIVVRYRKQGDRINPIGLKGTKKLKDIFIDMKIPKDVRDTIPIVQIDDDIAWVVGVKVSDKFKVTQQTKRILKMEYRKEL